MASVLSKLAVQISANTADFGKAMTNAQNQLGKLAKESEKTNKILNGFSNTLGALGLAFGTSQVLQFAFDVSRLAGEAEGVSKAFEKLGNSKKLLLDLKEATAGTVSELTLMKRAVQFSNFGLELEKLPTLLQFATKRAQDTGQSVDYLVDSIVTGLGRKSVLILDNLGISAVQLREEMAKVGDITVAVSNIIERDVNNSGKVLETQAIRTERLAASWENFKVAIGSAANDTGILGSSLEALNESLVVLASNLSGGEKLLFFASGPAAKAAIVAKLIAQETSEAIIQTKRLETATKEAAEGYKKYGENIEAFQKTLSGDSKYRELAVKQYKELLTATQKQTSLEGTLQGAMEEQAVLQKQKLTLRGAELAQTNIRLQQLAEEIALLDRYGLAQEKILKNTSTRRRVAESGVDTSSLFPPPPTSDQLAAFIKPVETVTSQTALLFHELSGTMTEFSEGFKSTIIDIGPLIQQFGVDMAIGLGEALGGAQKFGTSFLQAISVFLSQLGKQMIIAGIAKDKFEKLLKIPGAGPAIAAAGVALVAAAAAVRNSLSSGISGRGGSSYNGGGGGNTYSNTQRVIFDGQFKIEGRDLVLAVDKNRTLDAQRKG